jgi:hypothetical protein
MIRNVLLLLMVALFALNCSGIKTKGTENLPEVEKQLFKENNYKTWNKGQFYVHYPADSYSAKKSQDFKEQLEQAKANVLRAVGLSTYEKEVHFIVFESQDAMNAHVRKQLRYYVRPGYEIAYFVHNEDRDPYFTRTLFQLVAIDAWGPPKAEILAFGGALFAKGICQDITYFIDEVGAQLIREEKALSVRALMRNFGPALIQFPARSEIHAGALYQFIYDNFGIEKVKQAWREGMPRIEGVIYLTPSEIEKEILDRWRNYTPTEEVDLDKIELKGC